MKKVKLLLSAILVLSIVAVLPISAAAPVDICNIVEKSATIDGVVSAGEWDDATKLVLNISDTSEWAEDGAGIVGGTGYDTYEHTDDDFTSALSFMVDNEYLYILLTRKDSTINFATDNFRTPYASDCALMWIYNTDEAKQYGLQLLASDKSGTPIIGYFDSDANQATSTNLMESGDAEAVTTVSDNGYVMEAKIKLSAMEDLSLDLLKSGSMTVTYCAVNICEEGWDSDSGEFALWGENYQAQYKGVGAWDLAPQIQVIAATAAETPDETPDETSAETTPDETPEQTTGETPDETTGSTETPVTQNPSKDTSSPSTADFAAIAIFAACITAAGACVVARKKK